MNQETVVERSLLYNIGGVRDRVVRYSFVVACLSSAQVAVRFTSVGFCVGTLECKTRTDSENARAGSWPPEHECLRAETFYNTM